MANVAVLALQALQSCVALQHLRTTESVHNSQFLPHTTFVGGYKFRSLPRTSPTGFGRGSGLGRTNGPLDRVISGPLYVRGMGFESFRNPSVVQLYAAFFLPGAPVELSPVFKLVRTEQTQCSA